MSVIVSSLRALIQAEMAALRLPELGVVTRVYTNDGGSGEVANEVDLRLRGSTLELQRVPVAVGRLGLSCAPRVGDLVVLAFIGGDLNAPIVIGSLYDERVLAPDAGADESVYVVPDDARDGARRVELQLPNDHKVTIEDAKVTIAMGSTTMTVEADGAITLEAGGAGAEHDGAADGDWRPRHQRTSGTAAWTGEAVARAMVDGIGFTWR